LKRNRFESSIRFVDGVESALVRPEAAHNPLSRKRRRRQQTTKTDVRAQHFPRDDPALLAAAASAPLGAPALAAKQRPCDAPSTPEEDVAFAGGAVPHHARARRAASGRFAGSGLSRDADGRGQVPVPRRRGLDGLRRRKRRARPKGTWRGEAWWSAFLISSDLLLPSTTNGQQSSYIWCNGVMIARDILLTTGYCRPST
jgi:hypothetical protein